MKNALLIVGAMLIPFYLGYELSSMTYENMLSKMQVKAEKEKAQLIAELQEKEKQHQEKVNQIEHSHNENIALINNKYNNLTYEFERLQFTNNESNSTDSKPMSEVTTTATGTTDTSNGGRIRPNGINYKKLLAFAKERDELAVKYNTLLKIYNESVLNINHEQK